MNEQTTPPEDGDRNVSESLGRAIGSRYLQYALSTIMHRALPARSGTSKI